ncbi:hypothetical protein AB7M23_000863 [Pseudomonas sp. HLS-6 TE3448]
MSGLREERCAGAALAINIARLFSPCWSWLACDGVGGVSVRSRRLHRGQARLLQAGAGSVGAGLPAMASVGCQ